jgi:catechol 2,3-dioxygenase-like lactoylglutathione lyase family enzyme
MNPCIRIAAAAVAVLLPLAVEAESGAGAGAEAAAPAAGLVREVACIAITVADADRSAEFFSRVLHFEKLSDLEVWGGDYERLHGVFGRRLRAVRLRLGDECVELLEWLAPRGRPLPGDSRGNDRWFQHIAIVVSDMEEAYRWLRRHRVEHASSGPQRLPDWNPDAGGIEAFYFKDPDGHTLEIIRFPQGKGDPKWHRAGGRLFLGIDHTAIVVADTDESLRFYRDTLGLRVAGASENHGEEQERLNGVFGARLRITALRAESGPGIELLEYLAPRDGRPAPTDLKANDLAHWQTRLVIGDSDAAAAAVRAGRFQWVSPGAVSVPAGELGFTRAVLVRDSDVHAMLLVGAAANDVKEAQSP